MKFLAWLKPKQPDEFDPKQHGHDSWKSLFAEIRGDEELGKMRDATGREPDCNAVPMDKDATNPEQGRGNQKTMPRPRPSWER